MCRSARQVLSSSAGTRAVPLAEFAGYNAELERPKIGKIAVAYLGGSRPDVVTENGNFSKRNIDLRLDDVNEPAGKFGLWFNYALAKGGTAHPWRRAAGDGTGATTVASSSAWLPGRPDRLSQDTVHRYCRCADRAGGGDRRVQTADNRSRGEPSDDQRLPSGNIPICCSAPVFFSARRPDDCWRYARSRPRRWWPPRCSLAAMSRCGACLQ